MQPGIHNNLKEMLLWCHYLNVYISSSFTSNFSIKDCTLEGKQEDKKNPVPFLSLIERQKQKLSSGVF